MTFLYDCIIVFVSQVLFFAGGWIFFVKQLFKNYEIRHISVQLIFSVTFALSLTMFELIIFEILGVLDSSSRYFHWRLGLTSLLLMIIAVIPLYICYSVIHSISFAKAAVKIQAAFRGHQVRTTMKKSETQTTTSSAGSAAAAAASATTEHEPTKAELEAEFDPNDKELCDAALKIQATFRGHLSRKLVTKEVPEDVDIEEITKKVAEELDIDLSDPELNKAATKIQASFRGHKTRKDQQPVE